MYQQCSSLENNRIILSCSNIFGIDTYPASRPQQSNFRFIDGIHGNTKSKIYEKYYRIKISPEISGLSSDIEIDYKVNTTVSYLNENNKIKSMVLGDNGILSYIHKNKIFYINPNGKLIYKEKQ